MKTLAITLLAISITSSAMASSVSARLYVSRPSDAMIAMFGNAAKPAAGLVKLAREGIRLDNASNHRLALLVGRGVGNDFASARGANWNIRVKMIW